MITLKSGRKIGAGQPAYIVAEVGSNWQTLEDCIKSIRLAKVAGADAVKFQLYTHEALYGLTEPYRTGFSGRIEGVLPPEWLPKLSEAAKEYGIDFMCSAFSPELIEVVDPWVQVHKVASSEACHVRMLEKLREIGKPVILSCGGKGEADIARSLEVLGDTPVILCYCVAAYPAREMDLTMIPQLAMRFKKDVGFSDHSIDASIIPPLAAGFFRACLVEKHVTFIDAETPDFPHSLNFDQFKLMCDIIRGVKSEPDPIGYTREENAMVLRHNRRPIATMPIEVGQELQEGENVGLYRSLKDDTRGISPFEFDRILGRNATRLIQPGEAIGPGDFV